MKLTITTLVIVEGSYIQGIFHSLEEHPGKAYQELVDQAEEMGIQSQENNKSFINLRYQTYSNN